MWRGGRGDKEREREGAGDRESEREGETVRKRNQIDNSQVTFLNTEDLKIAAGSDRHVHEKVPPVKKAFHIPLCSSGLTTTTTSCIYQRPSGCLQWLGQHTARHKRVVAATRHLSGYRLQLQADCKAQPKLPLAPSNSNTLIVKFLPQEASRVGVHA